MNKPLIFAVAIAIAAACTNTGKPSCKAILAEIYQQEDAIYGDKSLTAEQQDEAFGKILKEAYEAHRHDSVGLGVFVPLITNYVTPEEAFKMYEESDDLIKNDIKAKTKIMAIKNIGSVAPGKPFKEVIGVDALGADELRLSDFLGKDKPVLVDFWASWCPPCRQEIKNHLKALAEEGNVIIVGVAVWEKSVDDTKKAISDLGISWPVIYTGGRENSPTIDYGVIGIPTLFLLSPDGTILSNGNNSADVLKALSR